MLGSGSAWRREMRYSSMRRLDSPKLDLLFRHLWHSTLQGSKNRIFIANEMLTKRCSLQGVSVRVVECQYLFNNSGAPEEMCSALEKPPAEKSCSAALAVCSGSPISHSVSVEHNHTSNTPQWRTGSWGSVKLTQLTKSCRSLV